MKTNRRIGWMILTLALLAGLAPLETTAATVNSLFNPGDYTPLADDLTLTNGMTLVIDTKDGTTAPTWTTNGGVSYLTGRIVTNQGGKVVLALFPFGNLAISNGVSCTVTGNLGLVVACTGNMTIANTISLSGANAGGLGGPGADSGTRLVSTNSAPPISNHGRGGVNDSSAAIGYGGGASAVFCSGGGGYGGYGGYGSRLTEVAGGGTNYGDSLLVNLFGGSGGGAGSVGAGGGGGGALELIASGTLTISGTATQKVNGGNGSGGRTGAGGSGGGILLAAHSLIVAGNLQAIGGNGDDGNSGDRAGGGGGGGRVALYANTLSTNGMQVSVAGGSADYVSCGTNGAPGSFRYLGDGQGGDLSYPFVIALTPPQIQTVPATNIQTRTASLVGNLTSLGGDPNTAVLCSWGTNTAPWDFSTNLGATGLGYVTNPASGLQPNTTYSFAFTASNALTTTWGSTNTFTTLPLWPVITNVGHSGISSSNGWVSGYLSSTGESETAVFVLWGTAAGNWSVTNSLGPRGVGIASNNLTGLSADTEYYYQYAASNAAGWRYAPTTNSFATWPSLGLAAQNNSLWNPTNYALLAQSLVVTGGTMVIDTGDGTTRGPTLTAQVGGVPVTYRGKVVPNQSSNVWMSLFVFGDVGISNAVSCTVTGNLGLVLACTGNMTIANTISLSGANAGGLGGPGADSGTRLVSTNSAPPLSNHGRGGVNDSSAAIGYGGGASAVFCSGGGGYGGYGGYGSRLTEVAGGGTNYGDSLLVNLFGGSGGGAGSAGSAGGGGGGALELIASGTLTISGTATQKVNGGNGSGGRTGAGGSGGGILLAANSLIVAGNLQAIGGNGDDGNNGDRAGGGGGGGRVALYANTLSTNGMQVSVAGGSADYVSCGTNGAPGSFRYLGDGQGGDLSYPFVSALTPPQIQTVSATNIQTRTASLVGNLTSLGGDPNTAVLCSWGTNTAPWDFSTNLGATGLGYVTNLASGLQPNTTYSFAFAASNALTTTWGSTNTFTTLPLWPVITNVGHSGISTSNGWVSGYLSSTGESETAVFVLWGTAAGNWTATNSLGLRGVDVVSNNLTGLSVDTDYYYQYAASNAAGWRYAPTTNSFATWPSLGLAAQNNSLWNPAQYALLAQSLVVTGGTMVIDTGDGTTRGPTLTAQVGGVPVTYRGKVVPNQSSNVWMSLFVFGDVGISNAVSCTVTGNLGLVLACTRNMTIGNTISLSGANGVGAVGGGGIGGPGAEAGIRLLSFTSAPPSVVHGKGGSGYEAGYKVGQRGWGYGGGDSPVWENGLAGGGGGYGGLGGIGDGGAVNSPGGTNYGDSALYNLYGGSGGGAGGNSIGNGGGSGGGGGGALELIANGTLTVLGTSTQKVNGGNAWASNDRSAGGGSGGGMILAAHVLNVYGVIQAIGGNGGTGGAHGGGGGGGRVALYANTLSTNGLRVSVAGGLKSGGTAEDGAPGSFRYPGDGEPVSLFYPYGPAGTIYYFR